MEKDFKKISEAIRKENANYLARDKRCNALDLALYDFYYNYVEEKEGETEHEQYLLSVMEKEINNLRETIEAYKKEHDKIHWDKIEQIK